MSLYVKRTKQIRVRDDLRAAAGWGGYAVEIVTLQSGDVLMVAAHPHMPTMEAVIGKHGGLRVRFTHWDGQRRGKAVTGSAACALWKERAYRSTVASYAYIRVA